MCLTLLVDRLGSKELLLLLLLELGQLAHRRLLEFSWQMCHRLLQGFCMLIVCGNHLALMLEVSVRELD